MEKISGSGHELVQASPILKTTNAGDAGGTRLGHLLEAVDIHSPQGENGDPHLRRPAQPREAG